MYEKRGCLLCTYTCVDNCLVFIQNHLFRILLSGIVNFICFITCPTNSNCLCNVVSRYLF